MLPAATHDIVRAAKMLLDRHAIEMPSKGTDNVKTSQYPADTRKELKLEQRSLAYRDLQRRSAEERLRLETKLRERNEAISRLSRKLVEAGFKEEEVAQLAA